MSWLIALITFGIVFFCLVGMVVLQTRRGGAAYGFFAGSLALFLFVLTVLLGSFALAATFESAPTLTVPQAVALAGGLALPAVAAVVYVWKPNILPGPPLHAAVVGFAVLGLAAIWNLGWAMTALLFVGVVLAPLGARPAMRSPQQPGPPANRGSRLAAKIGSAVVLVGMPAVALAMFTPNGVAGLFGGFSLLLLVIAGIVILERKQMANPTPGPQPGRTAAVGGASFLLVLTVIVAPFAVTWGLIASPGMQEVEWNVETIPNGTQDYVVTIPHPFYMHLRPDEAGLQLFLTNFDHGGDITRVEVHESDHTIVAYGNGPGWLRSSFSHYGSLGQPREPAADRSVVWSGDSADNGTLQVAWFFDYGGVECYGAGESVHLDLPPESPGPLTGYRPSRVCEL